jgi:hypothetical protein
MVRRRSRRQLPAGVALPKKEEARPKQVKIKTEESEKPNGQRQQIQATRS